MIFRARSDHATCAPVSSWPISRTWAGCPDWGRSDHDPRLATTVVGRAGRAPPRGSGPRDRIRRCRRPRGSVGARHAPSVGGPWPMLRTRRSSCGPSTSWRNPTPLRSIAEMQVFFRPTGPAACRPVLGGGPVRNRRPVPSRSRWPPRDRSAICPTSSGSRSSPGLPGAGWAGGCWRSGGARPSGPRYLCVRRSDRGCPSRAMTAALDSTTGN